MPNQKHLLEIYEPYEYDGPNPLPVSGVAVLRGPNGAAYYLVTLREPIELNDSAVEQLLVLPRYNGDKIQRAEESACTVNIERVLPGARLGADAQVAYDCIAHWGVGKITPLTSH